jgi:hypothetical protein
MLLDGRLLDLMRTLFLGEMIGASRLEAMRADVPNWTLPVPLDARVVMHGALANRRNPKQGREDERWEIIASISVKIVSPWRRHVAYGDFF